MQAPLCDKALDQLFINARSHAYWHDKPISDETLKSLYELAKWGPTSMNSLPMRIVFLKSKEAKATLQQALAEGNIEKVRSAPVTAIVAYDLKFYERLPGLFEHMPKPDQYFEDNDKLIESTAFRNSSLQGAYVILAARALGLDIGAMSGFDNQKVDELFFAGTNYRSNFLINLGYGNHQKLYPRGPRLTFDEAASII